MLICRVHLECPFIYLHSLEAYTCSELVNFMVLFATSGTLSSLDVFGSPFKMLTLERFCVT